MQLRKAIWLMNRKRRSLISSSHIEELKDINLVIDLSSTNNIDIIDKYISKEKMENTYEGFYNIKTIYRLKGDKDA